MGSFFTNASFFAQIILFFYTNNVYLRRKSQRRKT